MHQRQLLTFNEFLIGLACMDPNTQHGSTPAEQRCRYIFRYYIFNDKITFSDEANIAINQSTLNHMTFEQFKVLINDINHIKKNHPYDDLTLENESINNFKIFGLKSRTETLMLSDFLIGVGQLKFRGTSVLFRLNKTFKELLFKLEDMVQLLYTEDDINKHGIKKLQIENFILPKKETQSKIFSHNNNSDNNEYELATHTGIN